MTDSAMTRQPPKRTITPPANARAALAAGRALLKTPLAAAGDGAGTTLARLAARAAGRTAQGLEAALLLAQIGARSGQAAAVAAAWTAPCAPAGLFAPQERARLAKALATIAPSWGPEWAAAALGATHNGPATTRALQALRAQGESATVLGAASWAAADADLAEALAATTTFDAALQKAARALARRLRNDAAGLAAVELIEGEALLAHQAIVRAATARGLSSLGRIGEVVAFQPLHHTPIRGNPRKGSPVRIRAPGVLQGPLGAQRPLLKAQVAPAAPAAARGKP